MLGNESYDSKIMETQTFFSAVKSSIYDLQTYYWLLGKPRSNKPKIDVIEVL